LRGRGGLGFIFEEMQNDAIWGHFKDASLRKRLQEKILSLEDFRREVARWRTHWVITKRNDLPTTLCTTLDSVNPVPSIDTILIKLCVLLTMPVASATAEMPISAGRSNISLRSSSWRMKFIHHFKTVSAANGVDRNGIKIRFSFNKMSDRNLKFVYLFCQTPLNFLNFIST
jgi:hypothetical protein